MLSLLRPWFVTTHLPGVERWRSPPRDSKTIGPTAAGHLEAVGIVVVVADVVVIEFHMQPCSLCTKRLQHAGSIPYAGLYRPLSILSYLSFLGIRTAVVFFFDFTRVVGWHM